MSRFSRASTVLLGICTFVWLASAFVNASYTIYTSARATTLGLTRGGLYVEAWTPKSSPPASRWIVCRSWPVQPVSKTAESLLLSKPRFRWAFVQIPHAVMFLLFSIAPALTLIRWRLSRGDSRQRLGLCRFCGYDLRGSPSVCPECGTPCNRIPAAA